MCRVTAGLSLLITNKTTLSNISNTKYNVTGTSILYQHFFKDICYYKTKRIHKDTHGQKIFIEKQDITQH